MHDLAEIADLRPPATMYTKDADERFTAYRQWPKVALMGEPSNRFN
jgi:hypothetical protein